MRNQPLTFPTSHFGGLGASSSDWDTSGLDDGETVTNNKVIGTRIFDGIDVCSNGNTIHGNTVANSTESAIHLDATCGTTDGGTSGNSNTVTNNIVNDATEAS
jgi:hypothetical protein